MGVLCGFSEPAAFNNNRMETRYRVVNTVAINPYLLSANHLHAGYCDCDSLITDICLRKSCLIGQPQQRTTTTTTSFWTESVGTPGG